MLKTSSVPKTITKRDLARALQARLGWSEAELNDALDQFLDSFLTGLIEGGKAKWPHFASFELRKQKARPGRNPKTNEPATVPARVTVGCIASSRLKQALEVDNKT